MARAKLIKSTGASPNNVQGKWYNLDNDTKTFIQGIDTGKLNIAEVSSALISGVPTSWARAKLFWFAMDYLRAPNPNAAASGLIQFYESLIAEWKGLIALMALYQDRVSFSEPIYMNPKGKDISDAFGRMLLDDADFWADQQKKQSNPDELPYIQLLRYNGRVIGGTSPFSIVFPGVEYEQHVADVPWYNNGKFIDPMPFLATETQKLQKLYLFLQNINSKFKGYQSNLSLLDNTLDLSGLQLLLLQWQDAIEQTVQLPKTGTIAKYPNLAEPFKSLLSSEQKVYLLQNGSLTFNPNGQPVKMGLSDLQNILLDSKKIAGFYESNDFNQPLSQSAVYYLRVNDARDTQNPTKYFALPLSMKGIQMFIKDLYTLVSGTNPNFNITGQISRDGKLTVDLTVTIDGQPFPLNTKEYEIEWITANNKVMMWPNFVSNNWNAYYLYSEYPVSATGTNFIPFFKSGQEHKIITVQTPQGKEAIVYSNSPQTNNVKITKLITYPAGKVPQNWHKYEVIKSDRPIAGLEIRVDNAGTSEIAGFLIVKDISIQTPANLKKVIVGIDFGSNNSCVYYSQINSNNDEPIKFQNRRLALVGLDAHKSAIAEKDELLFFSNEPTDNGQVKSWLHSHDADYVVHAGHEIAGGVAVNEKNVFVESMDKEKIWTQISPSTTVLDPVLYYNMKYGPLAQKRAYLQSLWLSICADLFADHCLPVKLHWSYPAAMSNADIIQYRNIYQNDLLSLTPILVQGPQGKPHAPTTSIDEQTESESVCKYALSREIGLENNKIMFMGMDIGGSTSDILLVGKDMTPTGGGKSRLYKQSSVRIAAGVFFEAVIKSFTFRQAILDWHNGQDTIKVENISEILSAGHKAPFYLNSVFDQLIDNGDFVKFYHYLGSNASFVFAIPAYVVGLLVFYAGKLCAKTIKDNNLTEIKDIDLLPFGKGGRLCHWLETFPGRTHSNAYYQECFNKGFGEDSEKITLNYRYDIKKDNKSEVSKGLTVEEVDMLPRKPKEEEENYISKLRDYNDEIKNLRSTSDIFAEKNIEFQKDGKFVPIEEDKTVESSYFEDVSRFNYPERLENFETFLNIFIDFGVNYGLVEDIAVLRKGAKELPGRLSAFLKNDSEYKKAVKNKSVKFEYRFPIFIAEGLCYLEQILIPNIFNR